MKHSSLTQKALSLAAAAAVCLGMASAAAPAPLTASAYSDKYPVQEFRFGIGDTNRSIGGLLGETVFVSTPEEMKTAMSRDEALTIVMTKDMEFHPYGQVEIKSNKTLTSYYGLTLKDCQLRTAPTDTNQAPYDNLVFRNLKILAKDSTNCMMFNIYSSRQIWIDHCSFESQLPRSVDEVGKFIWCNSAFDGAYKSRATDFLTLSYCTFLNRYRTTLFASVSYEVPSNEKIIAFLLFPEAAT